MTNTQNPKTDSPPQTRQPTQAGGEESVKVFPTTMDKSGSKSKGSDADAAKGDKSDCGCK